MFRVLAVEKHLKFNVHCVLGLGLEEAPVLLKLSHKNVPITSVQVHPFPLVHSELQGISY